MSNPSRRPTRRALARLAAADPALAALMARTPAYPGFPEPAQARRETHWGALARAILFQQLAGAAASAIHRRVIALTPGPRLPTPQELLALPPESLRAAGVSGPKQRSLVDLAERLVSGRLRLAAIGRLEDEAIIERLQEVRGIGRWSAQMFLLFRLGRLDVMPATDLGIQNGLMRLDGWDRRPTPAEVLARAEAWAPLRSVASWHLWRATEEPR